MSNAEEIIDKIDSYLSKSSLKTFNPTHEEFLDFIETHWAMADDEKYNLHYSRIIIGRMMTEYVKMKDAKNLARWIEMYDLHYKSAQHPNYFRNWYKGTKFFDAGNEEKALHYFQLSYDQNPDHIFRSNCSYSQFFNQYLDQPRILPDIPTKAEEIYFQMDLPYWQIFFKEDEDQLEFNFIDEEDEILQEPNDLQQKALDYLQENQEMMLKSMLTALLEKYPELQNQYEYNEEDKPFFMPDITSIEGFSNLLTQSQCYLMNVYKNDFPYFGFSFGCSWDSEHDLGFITYKDRVVEIGDAVLAFDTYTAENDLENYKAIING